MNKKAIREKKKYKIINRRPKIMVTIITVTYNHEKYLEQCLNSLVSQKTNFRYQIFVGDDCSTDCTTDIVREFAKNYPDVIVPIIRKKNIGSIHNFGDLCERVNSRYVTFCDGDDYWIDGNRLQKQVDFMETHSELNGCYCRCRIQIDDEWELENFYKKNADGELIWPDCQRGANVKKTTLTPHEMTQFLPALAINTFLRVNHTLKPLPDWFYNSYIGDAPYMFLQIGCGKLGFMPDIMSVYRRSNAGIFFNKDKDQHFLKTRLEYIKYFSGLAEHYNTYYQSRYVVSFENRIKLEVYNYLNTLIRLDMTDKIHEFFEQFPTAGKTALIAFLSFYMDSQKMTRIYGWEGNKTVARDSRFMHLFKPVVKIYTRMKLAHARNKQRIRKSKILRRMRNLVRLTLYWFFCIVPKNKNQWAFTSFHNNKYLDNSKYYYEYVAENHPEIKAVWFTKNPVVLKELKEKGCNVKKTGSFSAVWTMARCAVAVTDHFRMTDYDSLHGFNNRTKVVQLWHGVGLKSMGDGKKVKNTDVMGVRYCDDILPKEGDSVFKRFFKKLKYYGFASIRELYEKYFLFVCPGQERIEMIGNIWNIPEENYFMAGHPRNAPVYERLDLEVEPNVIYAPTYRFDAKEENNLVTQFLDNLDLIQETMEKHKGEFVLRLHPHTWRNYFTKIQNQIRSYDRIFLDRSDDIYQTLHRYQVIISDYSSIAYDFLMFDRPAVFFCYDYEVFCSKDAGFNLDYMKVTPGPKTYDWEETLKEVEAYLNNPQKDHQWRKDVCKYFFDEDANGPDNSQRITEEIKRRLKIK